MLTAIVGNKTINSFDNTYDKYTLKKWSDKRLLKCPVCSKDYEYCHGEVVSPYFRHKDKNCSGYFSEPETEEHKQGKIALYNWIRNQEEIENCKLEAWIPETKQRPDIYFEQNGNRYVIEYQCTPIASEYLERRRLYELAGIKDIWILGTEKYNIRNTDGDWPWHEVRMKTIEKEPSKRNRLFYLKTISNEVILQVPYVKEVLDLKYIKQNFVKVALDQLLFVDDGLVFSQNATERFMNDEQKEINKINEYYDQNKERIEYENYIEKRIKDINDHIQTFDNKYTLHVSRTGSKYYNFAVSFGKDKIFFVKDRTIDLCSIYQYSKRYKKGYYTKDGYNNISSYDVLDKDIDYVIDVIRKAVMDTIEPIEKLKQERLNKIKDIVSQQIEIVDTDYIINKDLRFKFIRDHNFKDENYILNNFAKEVRKLKGTRIIFLLKGSDISDYCVSRLTEIGFNNVTLLEDCKHR